MDDRNKMFDAQNSGEEASPDRTIVGGRPPEQERLLQGLPTNIQKLLLATSLDETFKGKFLADPVAAARESGVELRPVEAAILSAVTPEQLRTMAEQMHVANPDRREFLMKSAAAALAIVAGTVLPGCNGPFVSGGARPDAPPISWRTDLELALGEAAENIKPVLVVFWYDPEYYWDGTTRSRGIGADRPPLVGFWFQSQSIEQAVYDRRFLAVRVVHPNDLQWLPDQEEARIEAVKLYESYLKDFQVTLFPTILFLTPDRTELSRLVQPDQESKLLTAIEQAAEEFSAWRTPGPTEGIRPVRGSRP